MYAYIYTHYQIHKPQSIHTESTSMPKYIM